MPQIFVLPRQLALDDDASPLAGALLYFYQTATTTPQAVYSDAALTTPHSNPVVADAAGEFAKIYLDPNAEVDYRIRLTTADGVLMYQEDDIGRFSVSQAEIARNLYPRTAAEISAGVTPSSYLYPESNVKRYGAQGDRTTDDLAAFNRAAAVALYTKKVFIPAVQSGYYYRLTNVWTLTDLDSVEVYGEGIQSLLVIANNAGANCITLDSTAHATVRDLGIYGTAGSGSGINIANDSHYNSFRNIWVGWCDASGFRVTLGISNTFINCKVDQNNGFRPASLVGGLTDGSIKHGFYVLGTATGRNNNQTFLGCHVNAAGETMSVQIGDGGVTPVDSCTWNGGLIQGSANHREVYLVTKDCVFDGAHIEPPVGVSANWVVTFDACTNTEIRNCGVQGDVRMIGACVQSGLDRVRGYGVDIGASCDRCYVTNGQYGHNSTGPAGGLIKDRSGTSIIENLKNAANVRFASGKDVRNASTYLSSNMETWVGGGSPTVPCGFSSFGTPTIARENTASHVRSGTYSASVAHSSELDEGLQIQLEPINQFAGRSITVEAWVKNITTAGLAYIGMTEGGTSVSVYQQSHQADVFERMLVTFKVDSAATSVAIKFTGAVGTVKWDYIKITCEEHEPVITRSLDGTATPSISYGGQHVPYFVTQGTPTITNFLNPHVGKPFVIRFDGATVITDGDPIRLAGAGNFTGASGDVIAMVYCDDGFFRQLAPESVL